MSDLTEPPKVNSIVVFLEQYRGTKRRVMIRQLKDHPGWENFSYIIDKIFENKGSNWVMVRSICQDSDKMLGALLINLEYVMEIHLIEPR